MMKHASLLMLAAMFGGFAIASAQKVEVETEEESEAPHQLFIGNMGGVMLNCGGSFLGIVGDEVNDELVGKLNLPGEYGAIINEVVKESAAEKAGLQKEDVIVGYNGMRVESMAQLRRMISETPTGRTVELTIIRGGAEQQVKAELGTRQMPKMEGIWNSEDMPMNGLWNGEEMPENFELHLDRLREVLPQDFDENMHEQMENLEKRLKELDGLDLSDSEGNGIQYFSDPSGNAQWFGMFGGGKAFAEGEAEGNGEVRAHARPRIFTRMLLSDGRRLGATVQSLSPQLARYFKLGEGESGALVSEVHKESAAEKGGLRAGDVITAIDGEAVKTPMDLTRLISKKEGTVEVRVIRDGGEKTIKVDLGALEQGFHWRDGGSDEDLFSVPESDPDLSLRDR